MGDVGGSPGTGWCCASAKGGGLSPLRFPPCALPPQFSGSSAEQMKKAYSEFCSRHTKAVKEYKDLLARDKRFQHFVRVRTRPHAAALAQGPPPGCWGQSTRDPPSSSGLCAHGEAVGQVGEPVSIPPPPPCLSFPTSPAPAPWR